MDIKSILICLAICVITDFVFTKWQKKKKMKQLAMAQAEKVTDNNVEPIKADKE